MPPQATADMGRRRALLTDSERELIATESPENPNHKYQAVSRVRRKIDEELLTDVVILAAHHPELLEELREVVCGDVDLKENLPPELSEEDSHD